MGRFHPHVKQEVHPVRGAVEAGIALGQLEAAPQGAHGDHRRVLQQNGLRVVEIGVPGLGGHGGPGGAEENVKGVAGVAGDIVAAGAAKALQQRAGVAVGGGEGLAGQGEVPGGRAQRAHLLGR